jgi:hypothetical protein
LAVVESHLLIKSTLFVRVIWSFCEFQRGKKLQLCSHRNGFVGIFFISPIVVRDDLIDVCVASNFDIVLCLSDIHAIELFDELIGRFALDLLSDLFCFRNGAMFCANQEVIDLSKDEEETILWVMGEVKAWSMGGVVKSKFVHQNAINMLVP